MLKYSDSHVLVQIYILIIFGKENLQANKKNINAQTCFKVTFANLRYMYLDLDPPISMYNNFLQ